MRAFELRSYDGPDALALADVEDPVPGDDHVIVDVHAIGVNFPDLLMTRGAYQHKPDLPAVPGCEIAGVVRHAPPGCGWSAGDRVAAFVWQGGYAEQAAVPLNTLAPIADGVDLVTAAASIVNYHTVHFALARRGRVEPGETVLVMGAAGGIGTAAVQVARGLGARVIAGVANDAQAETAREAGATEVLILRDDFSTDLRRITDGRGTDVVLDPLGDWLFDEALRGLAPEGRILVVGFAAGGIPELKVNRLLLRNVSAVGVAWGAFLEADPDLMASQAEALQDMVKSGVVRPQIGGRFQFEELPAALHRLSRGEIAGKGVVTLHG